MTLKQQTAHVKRLRDRSEKLAGEADDAKKDYELAQRELWDRMDGEEIDSIKTNGVLWVKSSTIYGSVSDKAAFVEWAEEHAPELVQPAPRKALVNERVRQCIDNGEELPPGVNYYTKDYVAQRAA